LKKIDPEIDKYIRKLEKWGLPRISIFDNLDDWMNHRIEKSQKAEIDSSIAVAKCQGAVDILKNLIKKDDSE